MYKIPLIHVLEYQKEEYLFNKCNCIDHNCNDWSFSGQRLAMNIFLFIYHNKKLKKNII